MKYETLLGRIGRLASEIDMEIFARDGRIRIRGPHHHCPLTKTYRPNQRNNQQSGAWLLAIRGLRLEKAIVGVPFVNACDKYLCDEIEGKMRRDILRIFGLTENGQSPMSYGQFLELLSGAKLQKRNCGINRKLFEKRGLIRFLNGADPITAVYLFTTENWLPDHAWDLAAELMGLPRTLVPLIADASDGARLIETRKDLLRVFNLQEVPVRRITPR